MRPPHVPDEISFPHRIAEAQSVVALQECRRDCDGRRRRSADVPSAGDGEAIEGPGQTGTQYRKSPSVEEQEDPFAQHRPQNPEPARSLPNLSRIRYGRNALAVAAIFTNTVPCED